MREAPERSRLAPAFLLLALAVPVLAWPWLSGAMSIPWDAKAHFLPQIQFLAQSLARGDSPFWSPFVFGGHPQVADPQSMLFSPSYLLLALIDGTPEPWAVDMLQMAMIVFGGICLMVWIRDQQWHWGAALIAALCFCWGASMAWRIQHVGQVLSLVWLPVAMLSLERTVVRRSYVWAVVAGLVLARIVLGRDQVALLALYLLAGFAIWRVSIVLRSDTLLPTGQHRIQRASPLLPLGCAAAIALALSLLPVLLTALLASDSNRPEIGYIDAARGSLHPALLLTLLVPDVFGATGRAADYWGPPSAAWSDTGLFLAQNMGGLYIGAAPALLLVCAMVRGWLWEREVRFFSIAAALLLIYALGWYTPGFELMHTVLPGVDLFRRPADACFLIGALLAVLAGYALNRLINDTAGPAAPIGLCAALLALTAAGISLWLAMRHGRVPQLLPVLAESLVSLALATLVLRWVSGSVRRQHAESPLSDGAVLPSMVALAALAVADLAFHNGPSSATAQPASMYEVLAPDTRNETIAALKSRVISNETRRDRVELTGLGFHWPNASLTHGLENTLGYNPLRLGHYSAATGAEDHVGLPDQRRFSPLFPSYRSTLANLLGLRFIATGVPIESIDTKLRPGDLRLVARTKDAWIYENPNALPRVLFATAARDADFDEIIASGQWPEFDPRATVLLESDIASSEQARRPGRARLHRYGNTRIDIEVDSPDGGWVVLNDVWHAWWFADRISGGETAPLPLLRANVLFRAVAVEPGRHLVRFEFRPIEGAFNQLSEFWREP